MVPEGFDSQEFGKHLLPVAQEMAANKGSGDTWKCTENRALYHQWIFGAGPKDDEDAVPTAQKDGEDLGKYVPEDDSKRNFSADDEMQIANI